MKSKINGLCDSFVLEHPQPLDYSAVERILRQQMPPEEEEEGVEIRVSEQKLLRAVADRAPMMIHHADSEVMTRRRPDGNFNSTSSLMNMTRRRPDGYYGEQRFGSGNISSLYQGHKNTTVVGSHDAKSKKESVDVNGFQVLPSLKLK